MTTQSDRGLKLEACPFCGADKASLESERRTPDDSAIVTDVVWRVICRRCRKGDLASWCRAETAAESWNTRPVPVTAEVIVDDGMVERACVEWCRQINRKYPATLDHHDPMRHDDAMRGMMRAAITAALKAQKGVGAG